MELLPGTPLHSYNRVCSSKQFCSWNMLMQCSVLHVNWTPQDTLHKYCCAFHRECPNLTSKMMPTWSKLVDKRPFVYIVLHICTTQRSTVCIIDRIVEMNIESCCTDFYFYQVLHKSNKCKTFTCYIQVKYWK